MDAIMLSVTIISFLVALQLTQTIDAAEASIIPTVIVIIGVAAIIPLLFFVRAEKKQIRH
jgi:EamA domain-containing membrane protein RarD